MTVRHSIEVGQIHQLVASGTVYLILAFDHQYVSIYSLNRYEKCIRSWRVIDVLHDQIFSTVIR